MRHPYEPRAGRLNLLPMLLAALVLAAPARTQEKALEGIPPGEDLPPGWEAEDAALSHWPYFVELQSSKAQQTASPFGVADLPNHVLSRTNMNDLRLKNAKGEVVPFVPRLRRTTVTQTPVFIARRFNAGLVAKQGYFQESFELNPVGPPGYNEIEVRLKGMNFRRPVQVFGANDAEFANPQEIVPKSKFLVRYRVDDERLVELDKVRFGFQQFRFLQVRVFPDPSISKDEPRIDQIVVRRAETTKGKYVSYAASLQGSEQVHAGSGPGTAWHIVLGNEPAFCEKVTLRSLGVSNVERPMRLQIADPNSPRVDQFPLEVRWREEKNERFLDLTFNEVFARRLRLVVTDFANPPLQFSEAEVTATRAVRELIFPKPDGLAALQLYFGNPAVHHAPNYDLAQKLPHSFDPEPARFEVGPRQSNLAYAPPPPTLGERFPWMIYLVLGLACAVLAALLLPLARQALARQALAKSQSAFTLPEK